MGSTVGRISRAMFPSVMTRKLLDWTKTLDELLKEAKEAGVLQAGMRISRKLPTPYVRIPELESLYVAIKETAAKNLKTQTHCLIEGAGGFGKSTCALDLALRLQGETELLPEKDPLHDLFDSNPSSPLSSRL